MVNQFTVIEGQHNRRPDLVVFLNGLPLAVFELKNAADENATIWDAFNQLQSYKLQIPSLFTYNALLVISDGLEARVPGKAEMLVRSEKTCVSGGESPSGLEARLPRFGTRVTNGKV